MTMQILMHTGGAAQTNAFVIADEFAKAAVLFDAPDHTVAPLLDQVEQNTWNLIGLWLTHGHFDHLADHAVVKERFPQAKVLIHPLEEPRLRDPRSRMFELPFTIPPGAPDGHVNDGDLLRIGSIEVRVIHTPGHSPGHVMYHLPVEKVLVGGDLIICGAVGRTDLPGCDARQLDESIQKVMKLPLETRLLPGHCERTTLGAEMESNPYVQMAMRG
jgi:glyoxylase-like metal-dependent hydrolase (beta-lactamase superfamily II)